MVANSLKTTVFDPEMAGRLPPGRRIYAIGDIHGRADLLTRLHGAIARDFAGRPAGSACIVYLGDFIDRGPDSRGVVDMLIDAPLAGMDAVHLKGNHEELMLAFLDGKDDILPWLINGGDAALRSYGVELGPPGPDTDVGSLREQFRDALPPAHLAFFENLRTSYAEGGYLFVHAGIRPGVPLAEQSEHDLIWIRHEFFDSDADFGVRVVHGHSITDAPVEASNRIGVDTGAWQSGHLTAAALDDDTVRFLST